MKIDNCHLTTYAPKPDKDDPEHADPEVKITLTTTVSRTMLGELGKLIGKTFTVEIEE